MTNNNEKVEWLWIEEVEGRIIKLDKTIFRLKKLTLSSFSPMDISNIFNRLDEIQKIVDPTFIPGKRMNKLELYYTYLINYLQDHLLFAALATSNGSAAAIRDHEKDSKMLRNISIRWKIITDHYQKLKDLAFNTRTQNYDLMSPLEAIKAITQELVKLEDLKLISERRNLQLSTLDKELMSYLNFQHERRQRDEEEKSEKKRHSLVNEKLTLEMVFGNSLKWQYIIELLVSHDIVERDTYIWKEYKNSNKGTIISLLKILHTRGYYRDNKALKNIEIRDIALNTFGIDISVSHIKQHAINDADKIIKLIPNASSIT